MLSNTLKLHFGFRSPSELFSAFGLEAFCRSHPTGSQMWHLYSGLSKRTRAPFRLEWEVERALYPFHDPHAHFTMQDVPSALITALPHLTGEYERLFENLNPVFSVIIGSQLAITSVTNSTDYSIYSSGKYGSNVPFSRLFELIYCSVTSRIGKKFISIKMLIRQLTQ